MQTAEENKLKICFEKEDKGPISPGLETSWATSWRLVGDSSLNHSGDLSRELVAN